MRKNSSGIGGAVLAILGVAFLMVSRTAFPHIFRGLLGMLIVVAVLIMVLVSAVVFFALSGASRDAKNKKLRDDLNAISEEQAKALTRGRQNLMELRRQIMRVHNVDIRSKSNDICSMIDKILLTLREKPEKIQTVRQFFNYYLPTMSAIIAKYERLEKSGVDTGSMSSTVVNYLTDIRNAMDKLYANLFVSDMLDMSVEMEAMALAFKRDGLIEESFLNTVPVPEKETEHINLTL